MAKVHDRILEFTVATDDSAETLAVTAVKYYRDRAQLDASNGFALAFSGGSAAVTPVEITMGETVPPPTHIRFVFTAVA
jgi:hypothetical protein